MGRRRWGVEGGGGGGGIFELSWSIGPWGIGKNSAEKQFWKFRNRDFVIISWNFLREKINLTKSCFFFNVQNAYICKTGDSRETNELIWNSFIDKDFYSGVLWSFE